MYNVASIGSLNQFIWNLKEEKEKREEKKEGKLKNKKHSINMGGDGGQRENNEGRVGEDIWPRVLPYRFCLGELVP